MLVTPYDACRLGWIVVLYLSSFAQIVMTTTCGEWEYLMNAGHQCRKCRICESDQSASQDFVEDCYNKHPEPVEPWGRVWCHAGDRFPKCSSLEDPIGGHFVCSDGISLESRCRLTCGEGYVAEFQQSDTITCLGDGQWNYFRPTCVYNQTSPPLPSHDEVTIPLVSVLAAIFISTVALILFKLYLSRQHDSQDFCFCAKCISDESSPCSHGDKEFRGKLAATEGTVLEDEPGVKSILLPPKHLSIDETDDTGCIVLNIEERGTPEKGLCEGNTGNKPVTRAAAECGGGREVEHGDGASMSRCLAASLQSLHSPSDKVMGGVNNNTLSEGSLGCTTDQLVTVSIWPFTTVRKGERLLMQVTPLNQTQLRLVVWEHLSSGLEHPHELLEISDVDESHAGWYSMVAHTVDGRLDRKHFKIVVKDARLPSEHPSSSAALDSVTPRRGHDSSYSPHNTVAMNHPAQTFPLTRREPVESPDFSQHLLVQKHNIPLDTNSIEDNTAALVESESTSSTSARSMSLASSKGVHDGVDTGSTSADVLVVPADRVRAWTPAQHLVHHYMRCALRDGHAVRLAVQESGHFATDSVMATRESEVAGISSEGYGSSPSSNRWGRSRPVETDNQTCQLRAARMPTQQEHQEDDIGPSQCLMRLWNLVNDVCAMRDLSIVMDTTRSPDNFAHRHTKLRGDDIYIVRQRTRDSVTCRILQMACQDDPEFKVGTLVHFLEQTRSFHVLEVVHWYHRPAYCPYCSTVFKRYNVTARRTNDEDPSIAGHPGYIYHNAEVRSCVQPLATVLRMMYPGDLDSMAQQIELRHMVDLFCWHMGGMCKEHVDYLKHHHREEVIQSALQDLTSHSPAMPTGSLIRWLLAHDFMESARTVNRYHCSPDGQCLTCQAILMKSQKDRETLA